MTAATEQPSRLALAEARLAELEAARLHLLDQIETSPVREQRARIAVVAANPTKRPSATDLNPVEKVRRQTAKDRKALAAIEADIEAFTVAVGAMRDRERQEIEQARKQACDRLHDREVDVLKQAGETFAQLHRLFQRYVETIEEHDAECGARHEGGALGHLALSPARVDFGSFFELLTQVCLDAHGDGYRLPPDACGRRADDYDLARHVLPDLRSQGRNAQLSHFNAAKASSVPANYGMQPVKP